VAFSRRQHQGSNAVFLTRIENGQAIPVTSMR
jgi:branched-chain amino acid transport system substrate-binding protein